MLNFQTLKYNPDGINDNKDEQNYKFSVCLFILTSPK